MEIVYSKSVKDGEHIRSLSLVSTEKTDKFQIDLPVPVLEEKLIYPNGKVEWQYTIYEYSIELKARYSPIEVVKSQLGRRGIGKSEWHHC